MSTTQPAKTSVALLMTAFRIMRGNPKRRQDQRPGSAWAELLERCADAVIAEKSDPA